MIIGFELFSGLIAYSLQLTLLAALAVGLEAVVPFRNARLRYLYRTAAALVAMAGPLLPFGGHQALSSPATTVVWQAEASANAVPTSGRVVLFSVLAAGIFVMTARCLLALLWLRRARRLSRPISADEVGASALQATLEVRPAFSLSETIRGPLTYGVLRHAVLLPAGFFGLPEPQRQAMLTHELIHVRNRDWLRQVFEEIIRCLLWFHPAAHLLISRLQAARECAVDSQSITVTRDRDSYMETLLQVSRSTPFVPASAACLFRPAGGVRNRIHLLLQEKPMSKTRLIAFLSLMLAVLTTGAAWTARALPLGTSTQDKVYAVGEEGVTMPRLLVKDQPAYTEEAREAGLEGVVLLRTVIRTDGRAHDIEIIKGLGKGLDEASIESLERWKFQPGTRDGEPVNVSATVEITFRLKE